MKLRWLFLILLLAVVGYPGRGCYLNAAESVEAEILFSDNTKDIGALSLTPGRRLIVVSEGKRRELLLSELASVEFKLINESMEYKWHFVEEGKVKKEKAKVGYPLREFSAVFTLKNGTVVTGNLQTTVFYLTSGENTKRVIYRSKIKGREGDSLESLVYLNKIIFKTESKTEGDGFVEVLVPDYSKKTDLRFISLPALTAATFKADNGKYLLDKQEIADGVFACRSTGKVYCYYPHSENKPDAKLQQKVVESVKEARDFFDLKEVLLVYQPVAGNDIFAFLKLVRGRKSTLDKKRQENNIPWQLNIWRFKTDGEEDGQIMLAGRFVLARGIEESQDDAPEIVLVPFAPVSVVSTGKITVGK